MYPSLGCDPSAAGHSVDHRRLTIQNYTGEPPAKQANSRHHSPPCVTTFHGRDSAGRTRNLASQCPFRPREGSRAGMHDLQKTPKAPARRASVPARPSNGAGMPAEVNFASPAARRSGKTRFPRVIPGIRFIRTAKRGMIDPEGGICLKQVPLSGMIRPVRRRADTGGHGLAELIGNGGRYLGEQG